MSRPNYLFICSRNQWRSRTAETIFRNDQRFYVKSAGTARGARIAVTQNLLTWADEVFVMEEKHRQIIQRKFPDVLAGKPVIVLSIPDKYRYMDPDLVEELNDNFSKQ